MTLINCMCVGIGGFAGSVLRYLVGLLPYETGAFPFKTLVINVVGAFVLGLVAALAAKHTAMNPQLVLMLKVGLCGGFTTFSTFAFETTGLLQTGSWAAAIGYIVASVVLSVAAVWGAEALVR